MVGSIDDLWPEERAFIEASVVSRQIDFATGRVLARQLLEEAGRPSEPIGRDSDRVPIWPTGVIGSISHTDDACLVAISDGDSLRGFGVDVEMDEPRTLRFLERITTDAERSALGTDTAGLEQATRIFSIKEAVYKACFPRVRKVWGFREVEVELEAGTGHFEARVPESAEGVVVGMLVERDGRIWTVACWR